LTEGEVFEDEILAGTESTNNPTNEVPEPHNHGKNLNETLPTEPIPKSLILQMYHVLMTHRCRRNRRVVIATGRDSQNGTAVLSLLFGGAVLACGIGQKDYSSRKVGLKKEIPDYVRPEAPIYFAP